MILLFPHLDLLRLALASGSVPSAVSLAPVKATFGNEGEVWIGTSKPLAKDLLAALRRLGARQERSEKHEFAQTFRNWLQVLPVERTRLDPVIGPRTPVLFELADPAQLPELMLELLRLGNDRQGVRWLGTGAAARALLHVVGPAYYSLLRALEPQGDTQAVRAYVEMSPRVWVEIGYTHPFVELIEPPAGKLLLLRPPRDWRLVAAQEFRDLYEVADFALPEAAEDLPDAGSTTRFSVPLRLTPSTAAEPPEFWVLEGAGIDQLDELVQGADEALLAQLAFAVSDHAGRKLVVLRARLNRSPPPVLVLDAVAYHAYLKLPHLFLPAQTRLQPPLRRDAVQRLLAPDPDRVTWLQPRGDGRFVPLSLPETAFRPLADWVDYILDQEHEALTAWVQAARFDFEPFVSSEEPRPLASEELPARETQASAVSEPRLDITSVTTEAPRIVEFIEPDDDDGQPPISPQASAARVPDEPRRRLRELEQTFLDSPDPLDSEERRELWRELAQAQTELGDFAEAAACWRSVVWDEMPPRPSDLRAWLDAETGGAGPASDADCDLIMQEPTPMLGRLRQLLAGLIESGQDADAEREFSAPLGPLQERLEKSEAAFPVRTMWLAWQAFANLSGRDLLALARVRDRLLERLHQQGLRPELELPGFLRRQGAVADRHLAALRGRLLRLHASLQIWNAERPHGAAPETRDYIDLIVAFGLARLGDPEQCMPLLSAARANLEQPDDVHRWLFKAFSWRIQQALEGVAGSDGLPDELLAELEGMDRSQRYLVDRLRQSSRILEPEEQVDAYRGWLRQASDELGRELAALDNLRDSAELGRRLQILLAREQPPARKAAVEARVLRAGLEWGPRLGESEAHHLLLRVTPLLDQLPDVLEQARLLERALFLAAHFGQPLFVQEFIAKFQQMLARPQRTDALASLERLLAHAVRGLRKLGLREEIARLLDQMEAAIEHHQAAEANGVASETQAELLKLRLEVAAGRFDFGQADRAWPVLDEARELLVTGDLIPVRQTALACTLCRALGHAPIEAASARFEEFFVGLERITDTFTTRSHFSRARLDLAEALVMALISDEFLIEQAGRRWLEDTEFLIRRRIHRDLHAASRHETF